MPLQLKHLALRCADTSASRRFYETLGFRFLGYRPNSTEAMDLADGSVNLTLLPHEGKRPKLEEGTEYIHFGVEVDDAKAAWRALRAAGIRILRDDVKHRYAPDESKPPEGSFKAEDPDGNVVDITDDKDEWRKG